MTDTAPPAAALPTLDDPGRRLLFTEARTANTFADTPVGDDELRAIWALAKWPPTSANIQPMRVVFVRTAEGKARLVPHMSEGNQAKTASAPVTAILAVDGGFYEHIPTVFPHRPEMRDMFAANAAMATMLGDFNGALQAGYFIMAVRACGLAAGPMGGFDKAGVDAEFFAGTNLHSILVVNLGHPGENPWMDRLPRLDEDQVLTWA